jgi:hypothetical protein
MNLEELQRKLLEAARRQPPSDQVPYAFEQRVMAHLRAVPVVDPLSLWAAGLWRAAFGAVGLCAIVVSLQLVIAGPAAPDESEPISEPPDLEAVLLAPLEPFTD